MEQTEWSNLVFEAAVHRRNDLLLELVSSDISKSIDEFAHGVQLAPIHAAVRTGNSDGLTILVEAGADVNLKAGAVQDYKTPLHLACESGHLECVQRLVEWGADLYAVDATGHCPLEQAQRADHIHLVNYLLTYLEQRSERMIEIRKEMEKHCYAGDAKALQDLLKDLDGTEVSEVINAMPQEQNTLLYRACEKGNQEVVEILLRYGADGRIHPVTLYSPLYIATFTGHVQLMELLLKEFPELVQVATIEGWLPAHAAVRSGNLDALKLLLTFPYPNSVYQVYTDNSWSYRLPFDLNAKDTDERSLLFLAVQYRKREIVKFLLDYSASACSAGARVSVGTPPADAPEVFEDVFLLRRTDGSGQEPPVSPSAFTWSESSSPTEKLEKATASHEGEMLQKSRLVLNVAQGSNVLRKLTQKSVCPVLADLYCRSYCDVYRTFLGRTAFHEAVMHGDIDLVNLLLDYGADVNLPIHAVDSDSLFSAKLDSCAMLLVNGSCALAEACRAADRPMVQLLLDRGALDLDHKGLSVCLSRHDDALATQLLIRNVFTDPEYRVNKRGLDLDIQNHFTRGRSVIPSSMFPGTPVMVNWHNVDLSYLKVGINRDQML